MRISSTMKITFCFMVLVTCYIIYTTNAQQPGKSLQPRRAQQVGQRRNFFVRSRRNRRLESLFRIPAIICYYAKYGRWPEYNTNLRQLVVQFSTSVFAMSDESIKFYCNQVFQLTQLFRPRPRDVPVSPTRSSQATTFFTNFVPFTGSFNTLPTTTTQRASTTTTTFRPFTAQSTSTTRFSGVATTSTTTTTESPTASGTGKKNK